MITAVERQQARECGRKGYAYWVAGRVVDDPQEREEWIDRLTLESARTILNDVLDAIDRGGNFTGIAAEEALQRHLRNYGYAVADSEAE